MLHSRGFEATTAKQAGQLGKTDVEQLEYAISQKAAILTHNRNDFEALAQNISVGRENITELSLQSGIRMGKSWVGWFQSSIPQQPTKWKTKFFTFKLKFPRRGTSKNMKLL
ncbi:DUF5615 family PIN-like protein [Microcoleus sp.]|uniref:DUF5615 family PIN-like protein n=1 Tax=Microcoleus sp. TaxID=44472 RepID=UPI00403E741C